MTQSIAMRRFLYNLQREMESRGITQAHLAELLGVSRPAISRLLKGKEGITLERAERLAAAVGVPLSELLSENLARSA